MKSLALLIIILSLMIPINLCLATPTLIINDFDTASWPKASIDVIITDYTSDLDPEFGLLIDDKSYGPSFVNRIENHGTPLNVLFMVDISGSMNSEFEDFQYKMTEIANLFRSNDTFSMITFEENIKKVISFSNNPTLAGMEMGKQQAKGASTRLFDALIEANELLKSRPENGIIFLFSDGKDEGSIQETPIKTDYPIITFAPKGKGIKHDMLRSISEGSGGFFVTQFDINSINPSIIKWKQISGTHFDIKFDKNIPEFKPPITKEITFQAKITSDLSLTHTASLTIEKPKTQWWIWIIAGLALLSAIILGILRMLRLRVPGGKKVLKKRLKGNVHYIAWLNLIGSKDGQKRIRKKVVTIGSDPTSTLHIDDPTVSVLHAKITETSEGYVISDEDSASGVYVNEEAIISKQLLSNEDKIRLGKVVIEFSQSDFAYVSDRKVI